MQNLLFSQSEKYTMGVELELQLIDLSSLDLTESSPDLIYLLNKEKFLGEVTAEITEGMIEVCTNITYNYNEIFIQLQNIRDLLISACNRLNIGICGGGTHPFQAWSERKIYNKQRFNHISSLYGYLAKQFTIFGQHIHIGCNSGDEALHLLHGLNCYLPHFIALSASSPFIQRLDTSFDSARLNSIYAFPLSGRCPFILSWDEFISDYFSKMQKAGIVSSMKDFYWDIRPKPEFGTIELRVCDTPLSIQKSAVLAIYLQALSSYILEESRYELSENDYLVYNYNRFQACRYGMDGTIINPKTFEPVNIREDILATIFKLESYASSLGSKDGFDLLKRYILEDNDASYLRKQFLNSNSMESIVDQAIEIFSK
ncbi:MAG: YbdK family carboxylate-amine ligase [Neisseriaceae bacterium]